VDRVRGLLIALILCLISTNRASADLIPMPTNGKEAAILGIVVLTVFVIVPGCCIAFGLFMLIKIVRKDKLAKQKERLNIEKLDQE